jgi:hypothetical protein
MEGVIQLELRFEFLGVWIGLTEEPGELSLPGPRHPAAVDVVVLSEKPEVGDRVIRFRASRASLVCHGASRVVVMVLEDATASDVEFGTEDRDDHGEGDGDFLASIPAGHEAAKELAVRLLDQVREVVGGELASREGGQVWVNEPGREWTIKYQPRKRDFLVRVYGSPAQHEAAPPLDLKPDRPSYSRFYLGSEADLEAAVRLITRASELRRDRGRPR